MHRHARTAAAPHSPEGLCSHEVGRPPERMTNERHVISWTPLPGHSAVCMLMSCRLPCSALRDRRFEPMAHRELAALSCTVSLLFGFETAPSWQDWTIGTHGLIIDFFGECLPLSPHKALGTSMLVCHSPPAQCLAAGWPAVHLTLLWRAADSTGKWCCTSFIGMLANLDCALLAQTRWRDASAAQRSSQR